MLAKLSHDCDIKHTCNTILTKKWALRISSADTFTNNGPGVGVSIGVGVEVITPTIVEEGSGVMDWAMADEAKATSNSKLFNAITVG